MRLPREILFAPVPLLARLSLSTLSGEVRDEEKLESKVEEKAPECRLLRPPYPLSLNIELEAVLLRWLDDDELVSVYFGVDEANTPELLLESDSLAELNL